MKLRFSLRSLFVVIAGFAVILTLSRYFAPHVSWIRNRPRASLSIQRIPNKPLVARPPDCPVVTCEVGPISFSLPESLSKSVTIQSVAYSGQEFVFDDGERHLTVQFPLRWDNYYEVPGIKEFPDKAAWTNPRISHAIYDASSSDFSFTMSRQQLRWHKWLIEQRLNRSGSHIKSLEYLWGPCVEGELRKSVYGTHEIWGFSWSTADRKWVGRVTFTDQSSNDTDWIRHVCSTFVLNGNPEIFESLDRNSILSLIRFLDSEGQEIRPEDAVK